jgi:hypothetical protein
MLSVDESELPVLFILIPPAMVHIFPTSKNQNDVQTEIEMKGCEVSFLCIVCQLTGKVMHTPIKLRFPGTKATALLRKAVLPMKVAFALLKVAVVAAKVVGVSVPSSNSFPLSLEKIAEMADVFEGMAEKGANMIAFAEVSIGEHELGQEVSYNTFNTLLLMFLL